ncbi:MAG: Uma2 family endonuclease [Chloroflexota bacterium]
MAVNTRPMTADEAIELHARTGARYEIVEGEPREMAPTGGEHGGTEVRVASRLDRFVEDHPIGRVFAGEVLCRLKREPETARAADVAFMRAERLPDGRLPVGPIDGSPDLVVEIISPGESAIDVQEKIALWIEGGAAVVWTLNPRRRSVTIWRTSGASPERRGDDEIDAEPVLPGFRCRARDLFVD